MSEFFSHVLSNGLTVLAEVNPYAYSVSQGFFVQTGSQNEQPFESGVSHFLEHMFFKGSARRTADDVNREFDDLGANNNAYTSEDMTVFYASFLPEFLESVTDIWSDILRPALREEDFNSERQVVIEELKMYEDQPPFGLDDESRAAFFNGHPLGNSVIGTVESLTGMTPEIMRNYFQRQYSPDNIILCAAGKVDFDQLVKLAEKYCGNWEPQTRQPIRQPFTPGRVKKSVVEPKAVQQYVLDWGPAPKPEGRDFYVAKILGALLGDESGSRFYWELSDPGLAETAQFSYCDYNDAAAFTAQLACDPDQANDCLDIISRIYRDVEKNGFSEKELDLCRRRAIAHIAVHEEKTFARMFAVAADWIQRKKYLSLDEGIEIIRSIRLEEINQMVKQYPLEPTVRFAVGPEPLDGEEN